MSGLLTAPMRSLLDERHKTKLPVGDSEIWCLNLDQIESHSGKVLSKLMLKRSETGPSTYAFNQGTVLYSKLRPYLNKVVVADDDGVATTELVPLRCDESKVAPSYLAYFLRSATFLAFASNVVAGAKMPRMVMGEFWSYPVPLPPLPEQRRIAAILDQAEALRTQRRTALALLDSLTQSLFLDMFGDSRINPEKWSTEGIDSVCELIVDCVNRTAPVVDEVTPYKMIRTTNVKGGTVDLNTVRYVSAETFKVWNRRATPRCGDVLLTREAPLGEAGILETNDNVFLGQRLMLYRPAQGKIKPEYLLHSFLSPFLQDQFERYGSGSTVKHLPLPACRSFVLRAPPYPLQQTFATRIQSIAAIKASHRAALAQLDALFASLQQRAFVGQL